MDYKNAYDYAIISVMNGDTHSHRRFWIILILVIVAAVGAVSGIYIWQHQQVSDLTKQVAFLKQTQLPQKKFTDIDDCNRNGGVDLFTINGQLSACLGGKVNSDDDGSVDSYQAFLRYSAQNLPRIEERKVSKTENRVDNADKFSDELAVFLKQDYAGCDFGESSARGYYKILKEVPNRFALLNYGCTNDENAVEGQYFIIAIKLGDGWALLSPTNNMDEEGRPSCLLQDMFKISSKLTPKCFENTGYDNGQLKERNYP